MLEEILFIGVAFRSERTHPKSDEERGEISVTK